MSYPQEGDEDGEGQVVKAQGAAPEQAVVAVEESKALSKKELKARNRLSIGFLPI